MPGRLRIAGVEARDLSELVQKMELQPGWTPVFDWEKTADIELLQGLAGSIGEVGLLYIVTDISYIKNREAFGVRSDRLADFVDHYVEWFGESLFNGDVIVLATEHNALCIFHHEGMMLRWRRS